MNRCDDRALSTLLRRCLPALVLFLAGCASTGVEPLRGMARPVDIPRFMGDWYVIGYIPIHFPPFFSEKDAYNAVESYRLEDDGTIATTYTFRRGGFDGPEKRFTPRARAANPPLNSEWKMKFFWFLPASDFLILFVDDEYGATIIGVPDRSYVWIMARTPEPDEAEYEALLGRAATLGYDVSQIERVPQRW
jgi:apolipoprotein D and lipocalin family protein